MKTCATILTAVLLSGCFTGGVGNTGGGGGSTGGGGGSARRNYPASVHLTLNLRYSTVINDSAGNLTVETRWAGRFEGNSSGSTISGVNMVYAFENSIDGFSGASSYRKEYRGAGGGYDETTNTVTAVTGSDFQLTVGPSSFNAATGELFAPFHGLVADKSTGVSAVAGATQVSFSANIPAKLDSRCTPDSTVEKTGGIALDGDVYTGYTIRQTYTCNLGTTIYAFESSAQVTAQ